MPGGKNKSPRACDYARGGKDKKITNTLAQSINSWHPERGDDSGGFSSWFDHIFFSYLRD
jgi:hypothetical protein